MKKEVVICNEDGEPIGTEIQYSDEEISIYDD